MWGLGIGDWGWGIGDWGLAPIPNPQSPIPNPQSPYLKYKNRDIIRIYIFISVKIFKKLSRKNFYTGICPTCHKIIFTSVY